MADFIGTYLSYADEAKFARLELRRTGRKSLAGRMRVLGHGDRCGTGTTLHVFIVQLERGGYAVARHHMTIWKGAADRYDAVLCATPDEVFTALCDGEEAMRPAEESAWIAACRNDALLAACAREEV